MSVLTFSPMRRAGSVPSEMPLLGDKAGATFSPMRRVGSVPAMEAPSPQATGLFLRAVRRDVSSPMLPMRPMQPTQYVHSPLASPPEPASRQLSPVSLRYD